jgi:hypothetical protein
MVKKILLSFFVSGIFFLENTKAGCPVTNCNTDCGNGRLCSITQYENGVQCSWTLCYGKGPSNEF